MSALFCAVFFGCVAFLAMQVSSIVCSNAVPADDGPPTTKPPYAIVTAGAALLGAALVLLGAQPLQLGIAGIVVFALAACWASDALCGFLPDAFTLGPLAALLLFALAQRDWGTHRLGGTRFRTVCSRCVFFARLRHGLGRR